MAKVVKVSGPTLRTEEVAKRLGFSNMKSVSSWTRRVGVKPLYKEAGHKGQNVYLLADIDAGIRRMPGQGAGGGRPRVTGCSQLS